METVKIFLFVIQLNLVQREYFVFCIWVFMCHSFLAVIAVQEVHLSVYGPDHYTNIRASNNFVCPFILLNTSRRFLTISLLFLEKA